MQEYLSIYYRISAFGVQLGNPVAHRHRPPFQRPQLREVQILRHDQAQFLQLLFSQIILGNDQ